MEMRQLQKYIYINTRIYVYCSIYMFVNVYIYVNVFKYIHINKHSFTKSLYKNVNFLIYIVNFF